jgi:hypothetical protein
MILLQATVFMSMGSAVLGMTLGSPPPGFVPRRAREDGWLVLPPAVLLALVLVLGLGLPPGLRAALAAAAATVGGRVP